MAGFQQSDSLGPVLIYNTEYSIREIIQPYNIVRHYMINIVGGARGWDGDEMRNRVSVSV